MGQETKEKLNSIVIQEEENDEDLTLFRMVSMATKVGEYAFFASNADIDELLEGNLSLDVFAAKRVEGGEWVPDLDNFYIFPAALLRESAFSFGKVPTYRLVDLGDEKYTFEKLEKAE